MSENIKYAIIVSIVVAIIVVIIIIVKNTKKAALLKEKEDLNVRYNTIKTIPLAFKLNKAQAMARRNKEDSEKIQSYYDRYSEAQKHIDEVGEMLEDVEDDLASHNKKQAKATLETLKTTVLDLENEVSSIDEFLEEFSSKENEQRDISAKLKEDYRELKMNVNDNANYLAVAYEGLEKKLEKIEELFSQSEEWIYANDYVSAADTLDKIEESMNDIKECLKNIPDLVKDAKGVIPVLLDEVSRQYSLCRQRGIYLDNLNIDARLDECGQVLAEATKTLIDGSYNGVKEGLDKIKEDLNNILERLTGESQDYLDAKQVFDNINSNLDEIKTLYTYVDGSVSAENSHFNLGDISSSLLDIKRNVDSYQAEVIAKSNEIENSLKPSSKIKKELDDIFNGTESDLEKLASYKRIIDNNTNDEERAKTQLIKLQVVLNEVEVKVLEYHLPTIAPNYHEDLEAGRTRITKIKSLLEEIPLNIELLNSTLDEAIDFIYTFYNNVNNIVGMAIMVENAIVFGNKYRSSYSSVDRDLSKAEFSYLNGEYTKALKIAIECMEKLFPNAANEKILENS